MPGKKGVNSFNNKTTAGFIRGRFNKAASNLTTSYSQSISFDWRLYPYDISGSIAHARMLAAQGIIKPSEAENIVHGLIEIKEEIETGKINFRLELEDIHMNIEARLLEKIGEVAGKLHTARSRNDQVALDLRLYLKDVINSTVRGIKGLQRTILKLAGNNIGAIFPGYTHMQPAQPVLLAHHLLAYFEMLQRDLERFNDCLIHTDVMPLGSGALAGAGYNIDREFVARELGFRRLSHNSMDAVSDRDFVIEFEANAALCMMHLSRLAEELILWSTAEFGFVELDDAFTTSSSIMPQKKNPDIAELARGKTGRVYGHLMGMLTVMKGLPLTYDRDLQEDKEGLFDTVDTLNSTLDTFSGMIGSLKFNTKAISEAAGRGNTLATDMADYLVKKGEPFRQAHGIVAKLVNYAIKSNKALDKLSLAEYQKFSPLFKRDILKISLTSSIAARNIPGGTSPEQVRKALDEARRLAEQD